MSEEQQEYKHDVQGPGAILKAARVKAGLSVADIASKLHLKVINIEAIEDDNYDPSISLTFTKGYLKLYAKQVGVTEAEVLSAFEQHHTQDKEPAKLQSFSKRVAKQANDDRLMMITYAIIAVVVALVVMWWLQQDTADATDSSVDKISAPLTASERSGVNTDLATERTDADTDVALANEVNDLAVQSIEDAATDDADSQDLPYDESANAAELQGVQVPQNDEVKAIELVFQFSDNCWMNLTDGTGEAIAYGVKKSGRIMTVSGIPPFEVTLGAPEVVSISYDGVAVDMTRFGAGTTAKFTLPFTQ